MSTALVTDLTIFILALLVGIEVIGKVPATLHTPLMSATNSIHGIVLAGALLIGVTAHNTVGYILAFVAAGFGAANVVGGDGVGEPDAQDVPPQDAGAGRPEDGHRAQRTQGPAGDLEPGRQGTVMSEPWSVGERGSRV